MWKGLTVCDPGSQRFDRGLERIHHRLIAQRRGTQVLDRRQGRPENLGELRAVERGLVAKRATAGAQGRAPQGAAGAANSRDKGAAGDDEQPAGR